MKRRKIKGHLGIPIGIVQNTLTISNGGGEGSRTPVSTECEEDIYMLISSSLLFVPGVADEQATLRTI